MKEFFRFLKNEFTRIASSISFRSILTLLIVCVVIDGIQAYTAYAQNLESTLQGITLRSDGTFSEYPWLQIYTLFNSWIGGRVNQTIPMVFFYTLPIFTVIPYSGSYLHEEKTGYSRLMISKLGKNKYFLGKYCSAFLSGFLITVIPMLFSFAFVGALIPAYKPDVNFSLYYQINPQTLWCDLYFSHPVATVFINILIVGAFAGVWSAVPYVLSFFVKNKFVVIFSPYLVLLFLIATLQRALVYRSFLETSILNYIWLTSTSNTQDLRVFLSEMLALCLIPLSITIIRGRKADVF